VKPHSLSAIKVKVVGVGAHGHYYSVAFPVTAPYWFFFRNNMKGNRDMQ